MEINGKIIELLPEKSGQSAKGPWRKQEYILETEDQYPKKVCFMVWSDKIDELSIKQGEKLTVAIDIESREFNGRWYTDVKAWQVTRANAGAQNMDTQNAPPAEPDEYYSSQTENAAPFDDDEIPF